MSSVSQPSLPLALPETAEEIYENIPTGYLYTAVDGMIIRVNGSFLRLTGYSASELINRKRFIDLLSAGGQIFFQTNVHPIYQLRGFVDEIALDLVSKKGANLPTLVSIVQKRDADGKPLFNRMTIFNASERRKYEEELLRSRDNAEKIAAELAQTNAALMDVQKRLSLSNEELEREVAARVSELVQKDRELEQKRKLEAIGRLAGGVAHDFNNILTGIYGISEEIRTQLTPKHPAYPDILEIIKASEKAMGLTRQLLAVGRQQVVHREPLNVNTVLESSSDFLRRMIGPAMELHLEFSTVGNVVLDRHQLEQVAMNLILNSRDAMPKGGRITVRTFEREVTHEKTGADGFSVRPGPYVGFSVSDQGSGMSQETQARIFEPFFTTKGKDQGTGLGLATVCGIVQQNAGFIEVSSELHVGTCFTVCFPRADVAATN